MPRIQDPFDDEILAHESDDENVAFNTPKKRSDSAKKPSIVFTPKSFYGGVGQVSGKRKRDSEPSKLFPIFEQAASPIPKKKMAKARPRASTPKVTKKSKVPFLKTNEQYAIDAGQMDFDASTCRMCHMVYTKGEASDEAHHSQYHDTFVNGIKFNGWKRERVLKYFDDRSKIIAVRPDDPKHMLKKVNDLFDVADHELGIRVDVSQCLKSSSQFLILVSHDKRVAGFVAAEGIQEACRLMSADPPVVGTTCEPARVGVARLWVHPAFRRLGSATKLLDILRANFFTDGILKRSEVAFSDTTTDGLLFAKKYTGIEDFLIFAYNPQHDLYKPANSTLNSVHSTNFLD